MICPKCKSEIETCFCPFCGFDPTKENIDQNNNETQDNESKVDTNDAKGDLLAAKTEFSFLLFSILVPIFGCLILYTIGRLAGWSENSGVGSSYIVYLLLSIVLAYKYTNLFKSLKKRNTLHTNTFIANIIVLFITATFPIFALFYAFGGVLLILPVMLYCGTCWFLNIIYLISKSHLFRLCLVSILILSIFMALYFFAI